MSLLQSRREFTASLSLAGTAALIGSAPALADAAPPETTTVRLGRWVGGAYCWASLYLAGELMRADGLTTSGMWKVTPTSTIPSGLRAA